MYNLLEYSKNYRKTTGSLWNYYRDEPNNLPLVSNPPAFNYNAEPKQILSLLNTKAVLQEKHQMQIKKTVKTLNKEKQRLRKIVKLLFQFKQFWRSLDMALINCEVSLTLTWFENSILTDITTQTARAAQGDNPARPATGAPANATLKITETKLHVSVVTLSTENDKRLLKQLRTGFKRTIKWNKYRSEMTNQTKNNNLNYLIDPTFTKVNRLFVLSFDNENDRTSFSKYYLPNVQIKDFNVLINRKSFFDMSIKNGEET